MIEHNKNFLLGLIVAAVLGVVPAAAFDNASCMSFLVGRWTMTVDKDMGGKMAHYEGHSIYSADGSFTRKLVVTMPEMAQPQVKEQTGKWEAKPGPTADSCSTSLTPNGGAIQTIVLTVLNDHTLKGPDGTTVTRE